MCQMITDPTNIFAGNYFVPSDAYNTGFLLTYFLLSDVYILLVVPNEYLANYLLFLPNDFNWVVFLESDILVKY